jgi:predicted anti-sigma-YlaC factor YlaD
MAPAASEGWRSGPLGNQRPGCGDYLGMRCSRFREAISARLDGEDPGVPAARIDAHLAECPACRLWAAAAAECARAVPRAPVNGPALTPATLGRMLGDTHHRQRPRLATGAWRIVLSLIGMTELGIAVLSVVLNGGDASPHLGHELTALDIGLALGFLAVAWRPSRAWGTLPVMTLLVAALITTAVVDLVSGDAMPARESVHLLEVAGVVCLWMLAHRTPRLSLVLRLT